jgi:hypothetical protein
LYGEYGAGATDFEERRFFERLDARREFQVGSEDVEDYDIHKFNVGFAWQLPQNFHIEGRMGYFWKNGSGNRDDQGITSLLEIEKSLEDLTLSLNWESGYSANYFAVRDSGFSEFWRLSTNLTYNYLDKLEFRCTGSYGYEEFKDTRLGSGLVAEELTGEEREDYTYAAGILFTYHIIRNYLFLNDLSFEMEFRHVELDSDLDTQYYINNQYTLRLTATF